MKLLSRKLLTVTCTGPRRFALAVCASLALCWPQVTAAQSLATVNTGTFVRIRTATTPPTVMFGTLVSTDSSSIVLRNSRDSIEYRMERATVGSVETFATRLAPSDGALRGSARGFSVGFGIGAVLTGVAWLSSVRHPSAVQNENVAATWAVTRLLSVGGAVIGALIGAGDRDVWTPAALPAVLCETRRMCLSGAP
jgi:hypothetical protein